MRQNIFPKNIEIYNLAETKELEKRVVIFITPLRENKEIREVTQ